MGLGAGTGSGIDPFINNKQLVFMGDGTFFHSGQIAISNSVKAGQDINLHHSRKRTTAMTAPGPAGLTKTCSATNTPSSTSTTRFAAWRPPADPPGEALAGRRDAYKKELERTILADGVKVIIADKECGITIIAPRQEEAQSSRRKATSA